MFEKIVEVQPLDDFVLRATFKDGCVKIFDMKSEIETRPYYAQLRNNPELFAKVKPIGLGSAIGWTDEIDMASEWVWDHGEEVLEQDDVLFPEEELALAEAERDIKNGDIYTHEEAWA